MMASHLDEAIKGLKETQENINKAIETLDRLESLIHVSRAEKVPDVRVENTVFSTLTFPGNIGTVAQVTARTGAGDSIYNTRISFSPKSGFRCTCPDMERRKMPCKHVAALAVLARKRFWEIGDSLKGSIDNLLMERDAISERTKNTTAHAHGLLHASLKSLEK